MKKRTEGIYLKQMKLEHVRCFGPKQHFSFQDEHGNPSMWNIIIGDNGVGKTTVLRSIALALTYPDIGKGFYKHIDFKSFFRNSTAKVRSLSSFPEIIQSYQVYSSTRETFELSIEFYSDTPMYGDKIEHADLFSTEFTLFAYGASRKIGTKGITSEIQFPALSLFDEESVLINTEEWIVHADYRALRNKRFKKERDKVFEIIQNVFSGEVSEIKIEDDNNSPKVRFKTDFGWVLLHELSLGYKTLLAWMIDFAKGMYERYPESDNPLEEPAICLVDEIDLHLHPKFQQELMTFLSKTFPKTQFIVTAHSPLIVQSGADANIILLKKNGDHVIAENDPEIVKSWRADQILTSALYGLTSSRSPKITALINERNKLLGKTKLSKKDEARLISIKAEIGEMPTYETEAERTAYSAIDKVADLLQRAPYGKGKQNK